MFARQMGVGPKLFARIARFDRAVRLHNRHPGDDRLTIGIEAGHYDHQHMARDFRDFTSMSPTRFAALEREAPERIFGQHEQ
jgi:transcriptional regulator GlxA family with amidase domain